jgi:hypothetical protein
MAVWLYAYGKNGCKDLTAEKITGLLNTVQIDEVKILDCIVEMTKDNESIEQYYQEHRQQLEKRFSSMNDADYKKYLDSLNLQDIRRDKIVDTLIAESSEQEKKEQQRFQNTSEQFKKGVIKSKWEPGDNNSYFNKLCHFDAWNGLRIWFVNDLIGITGPFAIFSVYTTFQQSLNTNCRNYFHGLFKEIFRMFRSDFILYTHEWAGLDDEEDPGFNLQKLEKQSDWTNTTSSSIHNMSGFYFEKI